MGPAWSDLTKTPSPGREIDGTFVVGPSWLSPAPSEIALWLPLLTGVMNGDYDRKLSLTVTDMASTMAELGPDEKVSGNLFQYGQKRSDEDLLPAVRLSNGPFVDTLASKVGQIIVVYRPEQQNVAPGFAGRAIPAVFDRYQEGIAIGDEDLGISTPRNVESKPVFEPHPARSVDQFTRGLSHIAAGAMIRGGLHDFSEVALVVSGTFIPDKLTCGDLTILQGATVQGNIFASGLVKIFGTVNESDISASDIEIYETAQVRGGRLKANSVGIQVGARVATDIIAQMMRNQQPSD